MLTRSLRRYRRLVPLLWLLATLATPTGRAAYAETSAPAVTRAAQAAPRDRSSSARPASAPSPAPSIRAAYAVAPREAAPMRARLYLLHRSLLR